MSGAWLADALHIAGISLLLLLWCYAKPCQDSQLIPGVVSRVDAHEAGPAPHENSVRHPQRGHTNRAPVSARQTCQREPIAQGNRRWPQIWEPVLSSRGDEPSPLDRLGDSGPNSTQLPDPPGR